MAWIAARAMKWVETHSVTRYMAMNNGTHIGIKMTAYSG